MKIKTTYGEMEEAALLKLEGGFEDDNEIVSWVQYHLPASGEMVHRSAAVYLKQVILSEAMLAQLF